MMASLIFLDADLLLGNPNLEIGFGSFSNGCYLSWSRGSGSRNNVEFQCNKNKGDKFSIKKVEADTSFKAGFKTGIVLYTAEVITIFLLIQCVPYLVRYL